jgi:hypothetical protein
MDYVALRTDAVDRAGIMAFGGILASPPARQAFGSWAPTTLTVSSPRSNAGGRLLRRGDFAPGLPYAYVADPDGYEIEIWFE